MQPAIERLAQPTGVRSCGFFCALLSAAFASSSTLASSSTFAWAQVPGETPVASIGTQSISYGELRAGLADALADRERQHAIQERQLEVDFARSRQSFMETELGKLVDSRVLDLEAAAHRTTPEALLSTVRPPPVTDAELKAFYDARQDQIGQPYENVVAQMRRYLQTQADENSRRRYLDSLRSQYAAQVTLEPLREAVAATGPQRGPADAPLTLVEFSDFECPFCARFNPVLKQLQAAYPEQLRIVYRHLPLTSIHPEAQKAAEAAACADRQGKFWPMHDALFADQSALGVAQLKEKAARLGLDARRFDECLDGGQAAPAIAADRAAAEQLALGSTPCSFLNGRFIKGALPLAQMSALVEDELRRLNRPAVLGRLP
jgi:protein-disulfide isomerase